MTARTLSDQRPHPGSLTERFPGGMIAFVKNVRTGPQFARRRAGWRKGGLMVDERESVEPLAGAAWQRVRALRQAAYGDASASLDPSNVRDEFLDLVPYASLLGTAEDGMRMDMYEALPSDAIDQVLRCVSSLRVDRIREYAAARTYSVETAALLDLAETCELFRLRRRLAASSGPLSPR